MPGDALASGPAALIPPREPPESSGGPAAPTPHTRAVRPERAPRAARPGKAPAGVPGDGSGR
eukprot:6479145-Alexandrium_andersonii.AAC.1